MEWHFSGQLPANYKTIQPGQLIFCDNNRYYLGYINFQGKWQDAETGKFIEDIEGWAYLPPSPISFGSAEIVQEWNKGNGPVTEQFSHFLLFDMEEVKYADIDSGFFDSKNRTFDEVTYWIALPDLPLHFREFGIVKRIKTQFFDAIEKKLPGIVLEPFNEECLSQGIGELANTTINGVPEVETLSEDKLIENIINRWNWNLELWLGTAAKRPERNHTFGTTPVPKSAEQHQQLRTTVKRIEEVLIG